MKILFCYHSQSGNTALACRALSQKLDSASWDFFDVAKGSLPDLHLHDLIGFASWTYYLALPPFFEEFLSRLPGQNGKPAFVFSTFGVMTGQVLVRMTKALTAKGFMVLDGYSLRVPESYPVYIAQGSHSLEAPTPQELTGFDNFAARMAGHLERIQSGAAPQPVKIKLDIFSRLIPPASPKKIRRDMGPLAVDSALCDGCGICRQVCLYDAIDSATPPVFLPENCKSCWACFSHCPQKAIYTGKVRGQGHYPQPAEVLTAKLTI
jgi:NAD-dependent dihydropyrimidine dehydrogenase PreA subunit/flavodoxin